MKPSNLNPLLILTRLALAGLALFSSLGLPADVQAGGGRDPIFGARLEDVPSWLEMYETPSALYSEYDLAGLAGQLITYQVVDASDCPSGGMLESGGANACGLERARPTMLEWQNAYNAALIQTSLGSGVPPILLKNIFAWESQFWPVTVYVNTFEYGLGHMTEMGADSALRWNPPFYDSLCAASFSSETCRKSYQDQPDDIRAALRGVVVQQVNTSCPTCQYGLDLSLAERSVPVFAHTLLANASFVKLYLTNLTGRKAAEVASYDDLWKFTLASYNAGPGCFISAFTRTRGARKDINWDNISSQFDPACEGAVAYVDFISKVDQYAPGNDPANKPTPNALELPATEALGTELPTQEPAATEPPATEPPSTEPVATEPPSTEPAATELPSTEPPATEPPSTEPAATEPPSTEPPGTEPPASEPVGTEPPVTEPPSTEPPATEPPGTEVPATEPAATEPAATEPPVTETPPGGEVVPTDQQLQSPHVQDELVLRIDPLNREAALQTIVDLGLVLAYGGDQLDMLDTLVVNVPPEQLEETLEKLKTSGYFEFAEPNYLVQLFGLPNDPNLGLQTSLWPMQVPPAWDALPSMQETLVAVLDTGVDTMHPDLADRIWLNADEIGLDENGADRQTNGIDDDQNGYVDDWQGWNTVAGNNIVADDQGHGTHLAGIIGASVNNAVGMAGIAPNARLLPVKVLDNTGYGTYAQVAEGIIYAADMGARVINLGFGGLGSSELLQNAVDYAITRGALVIASAGNGGMNSIYYPAGYPGVIAVGAIDNTLSWASFSSSGAHISLVAPGVGIYSTIPGNAYTTFSGTSMAAAQVSGVATLLAGQPQFADPNALRSALLGGAYDLGQPGQDPFYGYGAVRAFDALGYLGPVLPTPTPWIVPTSTPGGPISLYTMAIQDLYGRTQTATYAITNPANSIDVAFNDLTASSTGLYGASTIRNWTFTTIDDTTFTTIATADLEFRLYMTGWVNDTFYIQVYEPTNPACVAAGWCTVLTLQFTGTRPPTTLTTLTIPVYSILNTPVKVNATQVRITGSALTGGSTDLVTIYIDEVRLHVQDALPPTPTPTSTPVFIPTSTLPAARAATASPVAGEPHNHFFATADECASCHRSHTAQSMGLRSQTGEEQVCFTCHGSSGPGTVVQPAFTLKSNTPTRFFSHGVSSAVNIHKSSEDVGGYFGGASRHIECEDCHAPHSTARTDTSTGTIVAPSTQQEMYDSSGVDPTWTVAGAPTGFTWLPKAEREYQVCFKCHSSFTMLPTYSPDGFNGTTNTYIANGLAKLTSSNPTQVLDSRDLAQEFNSYQVSFHPVAALGRNRVMPAGSFTAGWSQNSILYCSDCHVNASAPTNGDGPHGSALLHILDGSLAGSAEYITKTDPSVSCAPGGCPSIHDPGELCFKCHQYATYATGTNPITTTRFKTSTLNLHAFHSFGSCYTCHDTHGSEQDRLINFDTSVVTVTSGNSQSAWEFNAAAGVGTCYVSCHDGEHGASADRQYTP